MESTSLIERLDSKTTPSFNHQAQKRHPAQVLESKLKAQKNDLEKASPHGFKKRKQTG